MQICVELENKKMRIAPKIYRNLVIALQSCPSSILLQRCGPYVQCLLVIGSMQISCEHVQSWKPTMTSHPFYICPTMCCHAWKGRGGGCKLKFGLRLSPLASIQHSHDTYYEWFSKPQYFGSILNNVMNHKQGGQLILWCLSGGRTRKTKT